MTSSKSKKFSSKLRKGKKKTARKTTEQQTPFTSVHDAEPLPKPVNLGGRPTVHSPDIEDELLDRIAEGETLSAICRDAHMPARKTVLRWRRYDEKGVYGDGEPLRGFCDRFARARDDQDEYWEDDITEISDNARNDWMTRQNKDGEHIGYILNGEHVKRCDLRIRSRQWLLERRQPQRFGNKVGAKVELTGKDGADLNAPTDPLELGRWIAYCLGMAEHTANERAEQGARGVGGAEGRV